MNDSHGNIIYDKSFDFALSTIELYKYLTNQKKEYVLSKQLLRSGTSIGANVSEAIYAQSKRDFISKMHIALKETSETLYWLGLIEKSNIAQYEMTKPLLKSLNEISYILKAIISTSKESLENKKA